MRLHFLIVAMVFSGCTDTTAPTTVAPEPSSQGMQSETSTPEQKRATFDVVQTSVLRTGPSDTSDRKVNEKATRMLGETHYLQVDPSVTVEVLQRENGWAEIRVLQPQHLRVTHRGWIPESVLSGGSATNKRDGWIRRRCNVYDDSNSSALIVGYLEPPSSVGVADDGSEWLRLIHGPILSGSESDFLESPDFDSGLYIEAKAFTTTLPANW